MRGHSQRQAHDMGGLALRFNAVLATHTHTHARPMRWWRRHGFKLVGTVPLAFRPARLGLVATLVIHKPLTG